MANESIELLKNYDQDKMPFPAGFQEKLDGVPVRIIRTRDGMVAYTRQWEQAIGLEHILRVADLLVLTEGGSITGELYIEGVPFKTISGLVRNHDAVPELVLHVFDADLENKPTVDWETRRRRFCLALETYTDTAGIAPDDCCVRRIATVTVSTADEAEEAFDALMKAKPDAEGAVLHSTRKVFNPGKRCWGTQRMKPVPTIDLLIVGFEEARQAVTLIGLGMVGRLQAEFNVAKDGKLVKKIIGIGPGALTHVQRQALWFEFKTGNYRPRIAEIKYMRDETYDALRQPTFKHWRDDKVTADVYV